MILALVLLPHILQIQHDTIFRVKYVTIDTQIEVGN